MGLPDPDRTRVVLIGTASYEHIPNLPAVANNLSQLAELFVNPRIGGIPDDHCITVLDPSEGQTVYDVVYKAAGEATDTLVVYFAGHGMLSANGSLHLGLWNSEPGKRMDRSVAFEHVREAVLSSMASNKVVILDCCYSGAALEGLMSDPDELAEHSVIEGTYVLTATSATQAARAPVGAHLTAFTGALVDTITDGIPEAPTPLPMNSLYQQVHRRLQSGGLPIPRQRSGDQGHAITLFRNQWVRPSKKPTLAEHRQEWFHEIQEGLLQPFKAVAALGEGRLRNDLGAPALIGSLIVTRISSNLAWGKSTTYIRNMLISSRVFAYPGPDSDELTELITKVQGAFKLDGLASTLPGRGLGLFAWSPESTYMLLSEYWAAQRGRTVPRAHVEKELNELWDTNDSRVLSAHSSLPSSPLATYLGPWESLKAEPDIRVGNLAAMALGQQSGGDQAWKRWMSTRPWSILKARHLVTIGGDLVRCRAAQRALSRSLDQFPPDHELHEVLERTTKVIQEQLERISLAVEGMSAIEFDLLRERSRDEHFQDGCLATFWNHLRQQPQVFSPLLEHEATHGVWGPLPWWSVTVRDEHERQAATAILTSDGLPMSFATRDQGTDELVITFWDPGPGSPGFAVRLYFDLQNAVHACELLLLARRQCVAVDFLTHDINKWDDLEIGYLGTRRISIGRDMGETLTGIATRALRRLMPDASGPALYHDAIPSLNQLLNSSRLPPMCRYPRQ